MGILEPGLSFHSRKHPLDVPLERKPLHVEQSHVDGAQHHCGEALDRSGLHPRLTVENRTWTWGVLCVSHLFPVLWQSGDIDIVNITTKDTCRLKFSPYSYFSREVPRKVSLLTHVVVVVQKTDVLFIERQMFWLKPPWWENLSFFVSWFMSGQNSWCAVLAVESVRGRYFTLYQYNRAPLIWSFSEMWKAREEFWLL